MFILLDSNEEQNYEAKSTQAQKKSSDLFAFYLLFLSNIEIFKMLSILFSIYQKTQKQIIIENITLHL